MTIEDIFELVKPFMENIGVTGVLNMQGKSLQLWTKTLGIVCLFPDDQGGLYLNRPQSDSKPFILFNVEDYLEKAFETLLTEKHA